MSGKVAVLNFDQTLCSQPHFLQPAFEWIELSDIGQTNGYCSKDSLREIGSRLQKRRNRGVTLIGRGNYHYVSYLLTSELSVPFTLVLFDYHSDMMETPDDMHISCGSWVLEAIRRLPHLRKVLLIGVSEAGLKQMPGDVRAKVLAYPNDNVNESESGIRSLVSNIPTDTVYISIDKDVLNPGEAVTDWEQGRFSLRFMVRILEAIAKAKRVAGVDICGEYPITPAHIYRNEMRQASRINEQANRYLAERAVQWMSETVPSGHTVHRSAG
ncbi:arginase family protein [Paenibacillus cisolokensis]|uniref:arginase family protein n=1 Tax=Paenibacillus cisolokensis TaxID=1658519 RepID=UPI003D2CEDD0